MLTSFGLRQGFDQLVDLFTVEGFMGSVAVQPLETIP